MDCRDLEFESPKLSQQQVLLAEQALHAILESKHFRKSKRYPAFLETIVRHALTGRFDQLGERELGTELFERSEDWDTSNDSIVRNAAMEVRKRLAAYALDHPNATVNIELPAGSYTPEFLFRSVSTALEPVPVESIYRERSQSDFLAASAQIAPKRSWNSPWLAGLTLSILLALCAWAWNYYHTRHPEDFWSPVFRKSPAAFIVIGSNPTNSAYAKQQQAALAGQAKSNATQTIEQEANNSDRQNPLKVGDTLPIAKICGALRAHQRQCNIVLADHVLLPALQNNSVVLIGSFNNVLTERFTANLRYQIRKLQTPRDSQGAVEILDTFHLDKPSNWIFDGGSKTPASEEYALVARFHSDLTDSMVVALAGLTPQGTRAAGDLLASDEAMQKILDEAPKDWKGLNFEVVLRFTDIQNSPGKATVAATYYW